MPVTDPRALQGLEPGFRNQVERWLAAGQGAFWLPIGGGLRSTARQIELRTINGCPDVWTSPASSCRVPTAIPGTSRHERGQAVDISGDKRRAKELASQFGLTDIPREDWHFQAIGNPTGGQGSFVPPWIDAAVPDNPNAQGNNGGNTGGGEDDDDCLVHMPEIGIPFGSLPLVPDKIGGQCLFPRSWGRAVGGGFFLAGGVIISLVGIALLVGQTARLPFSVPSLPTRRLQVEE